MNSDSLDESLELLHKLCSTLEAIPTQLKGKRLQLYSELTAIKPIVQYQDPLSQGGNNVLKDLHSHLVAMATKLELYSINQSWPFSSEEQQSILLTLSRLKLSLLSLSDDSTFSADGDGMNDGHSLPVAPGNDVIQWHSRPGRTLQVAMQGGYIGSAGGPVLSYNTINEADHAVGHSIDRLHDREDDKKRGKFESKVSCGDSLLSAKQREEFLQWISPLDAMLRIDAQGETDSKLAYYIFYWLSCSKRPLTVLELQHAVAVSLDPEMTDMEPEAIVDIETLTDVCAGLIISDESFTWSQAIVRLVHYTMQEYLQSNQQRVFPGIHSSMTITCLTYLSFNAFSTKEWEDSSFHKLYTEYPLYEYASLFWGKHAHDNQEEILPHVQRFLQKPANVACASKIFGIQDLFIYELHSQSSSHTLYLPTVFSLVQVLEKLLPDHTLGPADGTLLQLASFLGHVETLMVLLTKLDANTPDENLRTPLSYCAERSQFKMVQLFLNLESIQPDLPDEDGHTPFIHACYNGHVQIVQLFLDRHDVNHNLPDKDGCTPFIHACHYGHVEIVQLLLVRPDINHKSADCAGRNALSHAVDQNHLDVSRLLLQHSDIQTDIPDNTGKTPLILAAQQSTTSYELMKLLLHQEGVDPESQDEHLRTALSYSAEHGHLEVVQVLLELQVIHPDLPDKNGRTPFIHACHHGHVDIVQPFLDRHDVNHNLRDCNGWTVLFHAVDQEHLDVAQLLLKHDDIQPDIPDHTGKTPLIWAAQQSPPSSTCLGLIEALLEHKDVNPDSQDEHLRTALSYNAGGMCDDSFDEYIRYDQAEYLLKKGATADLQDKYLRTPLSYAIESHQLKIVKLLLDNPAVDRYSLNLYLHTPIWSPGAGRLLKEYSEWKNHLPEKSDAPSPPDSSQLLIAASLDKVRNEGVWAWGFNAPQTQDQYTNNLDVLFLEIATPEGGGFHGSIHNPVYGTEMRGVVSITSLSTTTRTCLLSNLPLIGGSYTISPNKRGIYYEVRILEMQRSVAVGLACRPYSAWRQPGWNRLSAAWHLDDMRKFFESGEGKE
ncbi:ankyrin repeat-containing domain protein [Mycena floridula]|nr:ankyrin repeat-containing domain protein [Mycena floridula]